MPKVSVIIPSYNCSTYLERALRSALKQTYTDLEIVVADDGSTDETAEIVARYPSVRYVYQRNSGLPSARNLAVSRSSGAYLAYLDADDMWYPHKLQQQVAFLDQHKECGMVHSDLTFVDEQDRPITLEWHFDNRGAVHQGDCLMGLLNNCLIQVPTVVERRSCFEETSGFDERFGRVEDYLHWLQLAMNGHHIGYISAPLAFYRWRAGSLSKNHAAMAEATIRMFKILIEEHELLEKIGTTGEKIVQDRIAGLRRAIPGHLRQQGRSDLARHHALALVKDFPADPVSYRELLKSSLPSPILAAARRVRALLAEMKTT